MMDGESLNLIDLNLLLYGSTDPDMDFISNKQIENAWGVFHPTLKSGNIGKVCIFGTAGEDSSNFEQFKKMFYNPDSYK